MVNQALENMEKWPGGKCANWYGTYTNSVSAARGAVMFAIITGGKRQL
jgi:hypothetical protein